MWSRRRFGRAGAAGASVAAVAALIAGCPPSGPTATDSPATDSPATGPGVTGPAAATGAVPPLYLGLDSYLHWDKLPYLEIGDRVAGQSTADPGGSNRDSVNVLGTGPGGERVLFDQPGPGVLTFLRMQEDTGGPWRMAVDGGPSEVVNAADLGGSAPAFPYPLSLNTTQSQGSSILAAPRPYARGLRFASSAPNGNFYALYRKLPIDAPLPANDPAATGRVAALLRSAGADLVPPDTRQQQGTATLGAAGTASPVTTIGGSQQIRSITFRVPADAAARFGSARLQMFWDGETTPSVDAPVKYLAGDGAGVYQPRDRPLVQALPAGIGGDGRTYTEFRLSWPMPFSSQARIALTSAGGPVPVSWSVRYQPFTDPPNWVGRFHANYTDVPHPPPGEDMTFLDVRGSGKLVGTVVNFGEVGGTLEGDPHVFLDDSRTPQIAVTGTEEWGMGGDYWRNGNQTSLPLAGLPSSTNNPPGSDVDGAAEYRFLVADAIPFNNHIVVNWEHGAVNDSAQRYRATMLWYGTPERTAVRSDDLLPAAPDGGGHGYSAPGERHYPLTSAYEYTVRAAPFGNTVAATTTGVSFRMALRQDNAGAFLRRTLDSCVPNQRANVFVDGAFAGTWYNAGASGGARCWRDDDLPLPRTLTQGKRSVDVRIEPVPTTAPPNTAWTAAEYAMFSFVPAGR